MESSATAETDFDELSHGCVLLEFKEASELKDIIRNITACCGDQIAEERTIERVTYILDQYQEQPHLLDPHLEDLLGQILKTVRNKESTLKDIQLVSKCWYLLTKVRGYKVIIRYLPHEVADVEPVLRLLALQDPSDHQTWECRYCLVLWLSMVSMIPFDLSRLDSNMPSAAGDVRLPVMDRILSIGKIYLQVNDKVSDAAAFMMARFLTRLDVKQRLTHGTISWALELIAAASATDCGRLRESAAAGALLLLSLLFKHGKREDLLPYASTVLHTMMKAALNKGNNTVLRKLSVKLAQRTGLVFLKQRVTAWRYKRGSRSLVQNLLKDTSVTVPSRGESTELHTEDEDYDVPDEIEEIVDYLLQGLRDKDRIVRWSAAKGIGRLSGRLPLELADEVLGSVLQLFDFHEVHFAWHGGCLAVAELGRRGLLLPRRLPEVVPVVLRALVYDDKKGSFSIGADVRDAACYICWAFARAYEPSEILPYVKEIASALVVVTLFDREVNVRRAASASFQENVGRQGVFPHGIDIITTCDYYAVANRNHSYLNLSMFVADFNEYTEVLIKHLVEHKVSHWDVTLRELTSKAFHGLTLKMSAYVSSCVLKNLILLTSSIDMNTRHGAILCVGEAVLALSEVAQQQQIPLTNLITSDDLIGIKAIVSKLRSSKLLAGVAGEFMKRALCTMIGCLAQAHIPVHDDHVVVSSWQELMDDSLLHTNSADVQAAALGALFAFAAEFYNREEQHVLRCSIVDRYVHMLMHSAEHTRRGAALALGAVPAVLFYSGQLNRVLDALLAVTRVPDSKTTNWAECRRDAIKAAVSICQQVSVTKGGDPDHVLCEHNLTRIFDVLFECMNDYAMDSRGDIGACVREASMTAIQDLLNVVLQREPAVLAPQWVEKAMKLIAQQACEKINRTRAHAGRVFFALLYHSPPLPHIPGIEELHRIFPREEQETINWLASHETFPRFVQLLSLSEYTYHVLLGLVVSVGGITESLVKDSAGALIGYLRSLSESKLGEISFVLLEVFIQHVKNDRVSIPMLKTVDRLLTTGIFESLTEDNRVKFIEDLLRLVKKELSQSGDPLKLMTGADVLCGLLQFHNAQRSSLYELAVLLNHKYPRVRQTTASKLYETTITYDVCDPERQEEVSAILTDTDWCASKEVFVPKLVHLCELLDVQPPTAGRKLNSQQAKLTSSLELRT